MVTGPYGRQWISPRASAAFSHGLIEADNYCIQGVLHKALELYRLEASHNVIAARRLSTIKRQLRKTVSGTSRSGGTSELKLGFVDWYQGFFEKDLQWILDLFGGAGLNAKASDIEDADILIAGSYGNRVMVDRELSADKLVILFTGENICPAFDIHDFSITTRKRSYCGKNVRYPQWLSDLELQGGRITFRYASEYQYQEHRERDLWISAIYNNSTPEREEVLTHLRRAFGADNVHVYGSQRTGEINKFEVLSRSIINVCFENSLGEGYVTEKLLHARMMGCKALYWGDTSYLEDFRGTDTLNIKDVSSIEDVISWCSHQLGKRKIAPKALGLVDESLFVNRPSCASIYRKISEWSQLILAWRE